MSLIEQRHPKLGQLLRVWRAHCHGDSLPSASALVDDTLCDLAPSTVLLRPTENGTDQLTIATSGAEVDALYGEALAGAPVERLAPLRGDAGSEARSAIETAPAGRDRGRAPRGRWAATRRPALPAAGQRRRRAVRDRRRILIAESAFAPLRVERGVAGGLSRRCACSGATRSGCRCRRPRRRRGWRRWER